LQRGGHREIDSVVGRRFSSEIAPEADE
jgi:hypothetical protein